MHKSLAQASVRVPFPAFLGERIYMHEFHKGVPLPGHMARWQDTVNAMLTDVDTDNKIFLMVDQGIVQAGSSHRRPGKHIDGYWHPGVHASHGGEPYRGHGYEPPKSRGSHSGHPRGHNSEPPTPAHRPSRPGRHMSSWGDATYREPEALILASDVVGCRAYLGEWSTTVGNGGDVDHLDVSSMQPLVMEAGRAYIGNVGLVHESIPQLRNVTRTLVRLNVQNWEPSSFR